MSDEVSNLGTPNREAADSPAAIVERLRAAILAAGGRGTIIARSSVSKRTLERALAGEPVKRGTLLDLAEALGVRSEWLLTGAGPKVDPLRALARSQFGTAFPPSPGQWDRDVGARLQQAVQLGGGVIEVAGRSGISPEALSQYAHGRPIPAETMASVARAAGVSLDWLATGRGGPRPPDAGKRATSGMATPPPTAPRPPPPIDRLDPLILAKAMEIVEALSPTGRSRISMLERARRVVHVYELLITPDDDLPELPKVVQAGQAPDLDDDIEPA